MENTFTSLNQRFAMVSNLINEEISLNKLEEECSKLLDRVEKNSTALNNIAIHGGFVQVVDAFGTFRKRFDAVSSDMRLLEKDINDGTETLMGYRTKVYNAIKKCEESLDNTLKLIEEFK